MVSDGSIQHKPHKKYIKHLKKGGRVLRIDSLNSKYEILTQDNIAEIEMMGYNDLIILTDDKLSAIDMLDLIFKQQKQTTEINLSDIIDVINEQNSNDIKPMRVAQKYVHEKISIDGAAYDFKVIVIGFDDKEHLLEAQVFVDNNETIIMNLYPQTRLIGPYKNDSIYDEIDKAATEELSNHGLLCFTVEVVDLTK